MDSKANYTPGPWVWHGNEKTNSIWLCTPDRGRLIIMDFVRWGMNCARPRFRDERSIMHPVPNQFVSEVNHNHEFTVDHPDARLIAAAPELLEACKAMAKALRSYEMDVDEEPPYRHRAMLASAEAVIKRVETHDPERR